MIKCSPPELYFEGYRAGVSKNTSKSFFQKTFADLILRIHNTNNGYTHYMMLGIIYERYVYLSICFKGEKILFADIYPQFSSSTFDALFTPKFSEDMVETVREWYKKYVSLTNSLLSKPSVKLVLGDDDDLFMHPPKVSITF